MPTTGLEGLTMDSDYGYIYTFIQYLNMLINLIISAFERIGGSKKEAAKEEAPAAE